MLIANISMLTHGGFLSHRTFSFVTQIAQIAQILRLTAVYSLTGRVFFFHIEKPEKPEFAAVSTSSP